LTHLIDTDVAIDYLNNLPYAVTAVRPLLEAEALGFSIVVYAEMYEGLIGQPRFETRKSQLDQFVRATTFLDLDAETAHVFADIRRGLRLSGQVIGDHDIWIAATAIRHDLVLLTRDHHFDRIPELRRA